MTVCKRTLLLRAHQLKSWNKLLTFGACLKLAWEEAKAGVVRVIVEDRLTVVRETIQWLENRSVLGPAGHAKLALLSQEYSVLRAQI